LCVNQLRANLSGYGRATFLPGGWQKDHSMSIAMRLATPERVDKTIDGVKRLVGRNFLGEVDRNQTAFGLEKFTVPLTFRPTVQIDRSMEVLLLGLDARLVLSENGKKPDGRVAAFYGETRLGVGRGNCADYLDAHPDVRAEIEQKLLGGAA
jgi:hypothetical protein